MAVGPDSSGFSAIHVLVRFGVIVGNGVNVSDARGDAVGTSNWAMACVGETAGVAVWAGAIVRVMVGDKVNVVVGVGLDVLTAVAVELGV